ncbi:MAG: hypothetical protein LBV63_04910 [Candidatus Methanoplasma sp.]|jgi:hypothetical protein|nr:hypothetical protein [Candidatus Methanoplasma sp.]
MVSLFSRKPTVEFDTDSVTVRGMMFKETVYYRDFLFAEVRENMKIGGITGGSGYNGLRYLSGRAYNTEFGKYNIAADKRIKQLIVLYHNHGTLLFNTINEDETLMVFMSVKSRVKKRRPVSRKVVTARPKQTDRYELR